MSMSAYELNEGDAGRPRQTENEEIARNQFRTDRKKRDEFAFKSTDPAHTKDACTRETRSRNRRSKPKLASAQAVLSSTLEAEFPQEEQTITPENALGTPEPMGKPDSILGSLETTTTSDQKPKGGTQSEKYINTAGTLRETGEMSRKSLWRAGHRERWRGKKQEMLGASVENTAGEVETTEKEMSRGICWGHPRKHYESPRRKDKEHEPEGGARGEEGAERQTEPGTLEGEGETQGVATRHIFSRVLAHSFVSSSSSSSSSFNCSSAESDEVFSESEEPVRKKDMRRCRSWRMFLTMMQWSKRRQSSWVQLAGHQGNIQQGEGGEVLKKFDAVEDACLQALMSDPLHLFVPRYHGNISRDGERYIRLEDLLSGLRQPAIMDCKMGIRTYQEEEIVKARTKGTLRSDMYQKMEKVDPGAPTAEERAQRGVTKLRYMRWRDSTSSTSMLGFRIDGIVTENGTVLRNFNKTRTKAQVTETLLFFTKRQVHILKAYLSRLEALRETLKESTFFSTHEIIGSSLLFLHDQTSKANIWMIDFGKTVPAPDNVCLKHDVPWVEGNREDGYLTGLASLISLLRAAVREAADQSLENHHTETDHTMPDTVMTNKPALDLLKKTTDLNNLA